MRLSVFVLMVCYMVVSFGGEMTASWAFIFGGYKGVATLGLDTDVEQKFFTEPLNPARQKYMPEIDLSWRDWIWRLYKLERAFYTGNRKEISHARDSIVEKKRDLAKLNFGRGSRWYCYYMLVLEHSLIRLMQDQSDAVQKLVAGFGEKLPIMLLPDEDFDLKAQTKDYSQSAYSLRNMIVLALRIEAYKREHGVLPKGLDDVVPEEKYLLDGYGRPVSYTVKDGSWLLYSAGPKNEPAKVPFDSYVPYPLWVERGYRKTSALWLSPSYSQKQWQLYRSRCLYEGTPYECRMPPDWK